MKNIKYIPYILCLLLFALLLFRDPFSERTLIPNFEPFPDTFHYVTAARSFLKGEGLYIVREKKKINVSVPPLYSFALLPAFLVNNDPRMFYFVNILLSFLSAVLLILVLEKLTKNLLLNSFVFLMYITNYFIYWFPTLAMAENLILPLFLATVLLLVSKVTWIRILLLSFLSISFYATKYANLPLTFVLPFVYSVKIIFCQNKCCSRKKFLILLLLSFLAALGIFSLYEYSVKGTSLINSLIGLLPNPFVSQTSVVGQAITPPQNNSPWFSIRYLSQNLPQYLKMMIGDPTKLLWDSTPLFPRYISLVGIGGLLFGLLVKNFRFISFSLIVMLLSEILFMSAFYSIDARYILHAIPTLVLGFNIFLIILFKYLTGKKLKLLFYAMFLSVFLFFLISNAVRLKKQIMLNIKYSETPWYYVSIQKLNSYFIFDKFNDGKKPVVISAMPPYLIDFFSNGNYTLLPLSYEQEFRDSKTLVWGPNDYSDLPKLYTKYIKEGYPVYVERYGLGNESYTNRDFKIIENRFKLTKVLEGCFEQCNIYSVELKNDQP